MKKPILFILLGLVAIAIFVFLHLSFVILLRAQGVEEKLARMIGAVLFNAAILGMIWLLLTFFKSYSDRNTSQNRTKHNDWRGVLGFVAIWLIGKPVVLFALEQSGLQNSWWFRWMNGFDSVILIIALGLIWWLERRNLAKNEEKEAK